MKTIRRQFLIYGSLCSLGFLASLALFDRNIYTAIEVFLTVLFALLSVMEYRKLTFAQVIMENSIISIETAQTEQKSPKSDHIVITADAIDIYISCFGILLGPRIIKFNTEGIRLERVDIGKDFIGIYYGRGEKRQFIRLLNRAVKDSELEDIAERFRRETGIIPNIIAECLPPPKMPAHF